MAGGRALADDIRSRRQLLWMLIGSVVLISFSGGLLIAFGAPEAVADSDALRFGAGGIIVMVGGLAAWRLYTEQTRCEDVLERLLDERRNSERLEHIDTLRRDAVATTVHDLRTPLTTILGAAKTLQTRREQIDSAKVDDLLAQIEKQSIKMAGLIDSVLDVSRIEAGSLTLKREQIDLRDLTIGVVGDLLSSPLGRARDVRISMDPEYPSMWGDPLAMQQIVANLVENALKYGGDPIEVTVKDRANEIVLTVTDKGSGIPSDQLDEIFDKFKRVGDTGDGAGLGLYIVGNLVEAHGGAVRVESEPSLGTRFTVRFPKRSTDRTLDLTT